MATNPIAPNQHAHDAQADQPEDAEPQPQAPMQPPRNQRIEQLAADLPPGGPRRRFGPSVPPTSGVNSFAALPDNAEVPALVPVIAKFLSASDTRVLSQTGRDLRGILRSHLDSHQVQRANAEAGAATVTDLAGFLRFQGLARAPEPVMPEQPVSIFEEIHEHQAGREAQHAAAPAPYEGPTLADLPEDLWSRPLTVLLSRLGALPVNDRHVAAVAFRNTVSAMRDEHRTEALRTFERIAVHEAAGYEAPALANEPVQAVLAYFRVVNSRRHVFREYVAIESRALEFIRRGDRIHEVAGRLGVVMDESIAMLEAYAAAFGPAGQEAQRGDNVAEVALRHGFQTSTGVYGLETRAIAGAAGDAARQLGFVQGIVQAHGFTSALGIRDLENVVMNSRGLIDAARRGDNVQYIARLHGITSDQHILDLDNAAIRWAAADAVSRGETVQQIAETHGITSEEALGELGTLVFYASGAVGSVANGENVRAVIDQFDVTRPDHIDVLEDTAVRRLSLGRHEEYERNGVTSTVTYMAMQDTNPYNPSVHAWIHQDPEAVARGAGIESEFHINRVIALAARLRSSIPH